MGNHYTVGVGVVDDIKLFLPSNKGLYLQVMMIYMCVSRQCKIGLCNI